MRFVLGRHGFPSPTYSGLHGRHLILGRKTRTAQGDMVSRGQCPWSSHAVRSASHWPSPRLRGLGRLAFRPVWVSSYVFRVDVRKATNASPTTDSIIQPELITSVCLFITTFAVYIGVCSEAQSAFIGHL